MKSKIINKHLLVKYAKKFKKKTNYQIVKFLNKIGCLINNH